MKTSSVALASSISMSRSAAERFAPAQSLRQADGIARLCLFIGGSSVPSSPWAVVLDGFLQALDDSVVIDDLAVLFLNTIDSV